LNSKSEKQEAEEDIQKNTTLAYRSPEMCDLYSGDPINEKSDVWALGCILYKLCYFKGPFEDAESSISVINGKYRIPPTPVYSSQLIDLIKSMLVVSVKSRPSVFDITERVGKLIGKEVTLQRPVARPTPVQTKPTTPTKVNTPSGGGGGDLFSQLDWFDNGGNSQPAQQPQQTFNPPQRRTPTTPVVKKQPVQQNAFEENDNWADFSDFDNGSSFGTAATAPSPKVQQTKSVMPPLSPQKSGGGDLFSQLDWQESSSPIPQQKPLPQPPVQQPQQVVRPVATPQPQRTMLVETQNVHKRSLSESFNEMSVSTPSPTLQVPPRSSSTSPVLPPTAALNSESRRLAVSRATTNAPRQSRPSQISLICNDLFNNGKVFIETLVYIRERPIFSEPNVCVKALVLIHHILQSALNDNCDPNETKSLLQDIKESWKPKNQLIAKFIVEYSTWLEKRVDVTTLCSVNCNFSIKNTLEINQISELIDLLDSLMQLQKTITAEKTPSPKMGSIIPVVSDAYDIYLCATYSLQKCSEANKFSEEVKKVSLKFNQVYTNLSRFVSQIGQFKPQVGSVRPLPPLSPNPPSFFGLNKVATQPPSNPTAPTIFSPNFEYNEPDEPFIYKSLALPTEPVTQNDVLKKEGNNCCADCSSTQVQWANLSFGVTLCTPCRLAHFNLKTGRLESLTLNNAKLSNEQLAFVYAVGNKTANEYYELSVPPNIKPTTNVNQPNLQTYVRNKYVSKLYTRGHGDSSVSHVRAPSGGFDALNPQQFFM